VHRYDQLVQAVLLGERRRRGDQGLAGSAPLVPVGDHRVAHVRGRQVEQRVRRRDAQQRRPERLVTLAHREHQPPIGGGEHLAVALLQAHLPGRRPLPADDVRRREQRIA